MIQPTAKSFLIELYDRASRERDALLSQLRHTPSRRHRSGVRIPFDDLTDSLAHCQTELEQIRSALRNLEAQQHEAADATATP